MIQLFQYQKEGVEVLVNNKEILLADEQGLGKTCQVITSINEVRAFPVLVVCPNSLKFNWKNEVNKFGDGTYEATVIKANTNWKEVEPNGFYCVNYESLFKHKETLDSVAWGTLVVDESHRLRKKYSRMAKQIFGEWSKEQYKWILKKIVAERKIFISATPVAKCVYDLYPTLSYLDKDRFGYNTFLKYFYKDRFGSKKSTDKHIQDFGKLLKSSGIMLRRRKCDVLDLPEKLYSDIVLDIDDLKASEREAVLQEIEIVSKMETTEIDITTMSALRRLTGLAKVSSVASIASDVIDSEGYVVIGAVHRDVITGISEALRKEKYTTGIIDGSCSDVEKQRIVDQFQRGEIQALVCNIQSAGVGITLTKASNLIFAERMWNEIDNEQFEDRIHRIGQGMTCNYTSIFFQGTMDWFVNRSNQNKKGLANIYNK